MGYPNAYNYDSDVDYYKDCINCNPASVKAHFREELNKLIEEFENNIQAILENYEYSEDGDYSGEISDLLFDLREAVKKSEPVKLIDL